MQFRRNEYDVTDRVNLRRPETVFTEVSAIMSDFCTDAMCTKVHMAFRNLAQLYKGQLNGYEPCDVPYHDLQHIMDVTLATTRLLAGFEHSQRPSRRLGPNRIMLGIILALYHDCGYIRDAHKDRLENGAEYTLTHITRGAEYLRGYLPELGLEKYSDLMVNLIHYTGYEKPVETIRLDDPRDEILGFLVGTADLLAQMSDRCYLEKCRDRLYPEFVLGGMASKTDASGQQIVIYSSAEDLLRKTPDFYERMVKPRLEQKFHNVADFAGHYFDGQNLYQEEVDRNLQYLELMIRENDFNMLRRQLTDTPEARAFPYQRLAS